MPIKKPNVVNVPSDGSDKKHSPPPSPKQKNKNPDDDPKEQKHPKSVPKRKVIPKVTPIGDSSKNEDDPDEIKVTFVFEDESRDDFQLTLKMDTTINEIKMKILETLDIQDKINLKYKNKDEKFIIDGSYMILRDISDEIKQTIKGKQVNIIYIGIIKNKKKERKISKEPVNDINKYDIDINEYEVIKMIGSGSYSIVYEVMHKTSKKIFAAKSLIKDPNGDLFTIDNNEINIMKKLDYPTIIKFYGYSLKDFDNKDGMTIFLQFAPNKTLNEYYIELSKHGKKILNNTELQIILIGVCAGMHYLHQHKIMHRDLKPTNIVLDENNLPMITDFGIAKYHVNDATHTQGAGSPAYMAPEVLSGEKYNLLADVYSFGMTLYQLLAGKNPLFKMLYVRIIKFVTENGRPPFDFPIKQSFKNLIEKCLSQNPTERYTFEQLTKMLAYDKKYYLDDVDPEKVFKYANDVLKIPK